MNCEIKSWDDVPIVDRLGILAVAEMTNLASGSALAPDMFRDVTGVLGGLIQYVPALLILGIIWGGCFKLASWVQKVANEGAHNDTKQSAQYRDARRCSHYH